MLHVAKIKPLPEGLVAYFFAHAIPFMELEKINPRQLEEGLRKWNTGIHLLALDKKFVSAPVDGRPLCPIPMFAGGGRERWIFLSGSGPAAAEQHRRKFEIESTEQNLKNLETVGMLSLCEGA